MSPGPGRVKPGHIPVKLNQGLIGLSILFHWPQQGEDKMADGISVSGGVTHAIQTDVGNEEQVANMAAGLTAGTFPALIVEGVTSAPMDV